MSATTIASPTETAKCAPFRVFIWSADGPGFAQALTKALNETLSDLWELEFIPVPERKSDGKDEDHRGRILETAKRAELVFTDNTELVRRVHGPEHKCFFFGNKSQRKELSELDQNIHTFDLPEMLGTRMRAQFVIACASLRRRTVKPCQTE